MKRVVYTNADGYMSVREVPSDISDPALLAAGLVLGPPDLSALGLSDEDDKKLNNLLCEAGFWDYDSIGTRLPDMLGYVRVLGFDEEKTRNIFRQLIAIYQQASYGLIEEQ